MAAAGAPATRTPARTRTVLVAIIALVLGMIPAVGGSAASAAEPDKVSSTLEGCKNSGGITLPNGAGKYICPDAAYTSGNLGKGWNELDLVPYRLTLGAGNAAPASQTYTLAYAVDAEDNGRPGYDVLSVATLNTTLSHASCTAATSGPETVMAPGLGGIDKTRFRTLTVTQLQGTTCVYDYYARLALGSHLFPGSALHANMALPVTATTVTTQGIGASDVSIPVREILPQEISKTMAASKNADHIWSVMKSATPVTLPFGNSCITAAQGAQLDVEITVSWTKGPALATGYTVTTNVFAKNPAARTITVQATDVIKSGTTILDTVIFPAKDVPANTANVLLGTHTSNFTTAQVSDPPNFNDVATATYTDKVTGVAVPGTTTASASVANADIATGTTTNTTATVSDTESISGAGLTFSVATPAVGSFTDGYLAGTPTTGPVGWVHSVSSTGSVTFKKTVYLDQPRIVTGELTDTATVTGSHSGSSSDSESVGITSGALVDLKIDKTLSPASSDAQSFTFNTSGPGGYADSTSLSFPAGTTAKSATLVGLAPGSYTVVEPASGPFAGGTKNATITLPTCSATVSFTNTFTPPTARVRKVTVPSGSESGWVFTLTGTGLPAAGIDVTTTGTDAIAFPGALSSGSYSITETTQAGWDLSAVTGTPIGTTTSIANRSCSFSVNQIADAGKTFECAFTNIQRGRIIVDKVTEPAADPQSFDFTLKGGPSVLDQAFGLTDVADPHDSGSIKPGAGYAVAEDLPSGWDNKSATCSDGSPVANVDVGPGETVTCTFTNTKRGNIVIHKVTDPTTATAGFDFTLTGGPSGLNQSFTLKHGEDHASGVVLPGGGYSAQESVPEGWDLSTAVCGDGSPVENITVSAGETVHCYFTNTQRGLIIIDKVTAPAGDPQAFGFTLKGGASGVDQAFSLTDAATPRESGFVKPGSGYSAAESVPAGWDLTSTTCNDGSTVGNITVSAGETVVCTFTNTKRARVVIDKVTLPSGSTQSFAFGLTGGPTGSTINQMFSLTDAATPYSSGLVKAGSYAATEAVPAGWDLTSAVCDDLSPVSAIDLAPGETVTCTFTNTQRGKIKIDKVTLPAGSSQLFDFTLKGGPSELDRAFQLADATTPYSSGYVVPGVGYSAAESVPGGWDLTSSTCSDGSGVSSIDVGPGETVTCTFTNTKRGEIRIDKVTDPAGHPQAFDFTLKGGVSAIDQAFQLADTTTPHSSGLVKPSAGYAAAEMVPTGWTQVSATCSDGSAVTDIVVGPGEVVTCTFTNKARGKVGVVKTLNGAPIAVGSTVAFTFQLRQGATLTDAGTVLETKVASVLNGGSLSYTTELVPGVTYQMCEIVMPGWSTSLGTFVPDSFLPPDGIATDPTVDNSVLCGNFTVTPGQTFVFTVDNTPPPGGRALTIGFWKNWNSCAKSNGGQKPVLDQTLAASEPTGIVVSAQTGSYPAFAPVVYLTLHGSTATPNKAVDCAKAVALLNKSSYSGKKLASDPAFNLAAQLVAAELNYVAGAGKKPAVTTAITQSVLLLGKYQFNGSGYTGKISAADATTMNNLARILDDYNNNR